MFRKDDIVMLLGAGASFDAKIPVSPQMTSEIEGLLTTHDQWRQYRDLYHYIKSSILFADGLRGRFDGMNYNVETLVNTLAELEQGDEHPIFPFVGAWNAKLSEVGGPGLCKLREFRQTIVTRLRDNWIPLKYDSDADYYSCIGKFQQKYQFPLRVFSLNYDLCLEKNTGDVTLQRGFNDQKFWDWRLFDDSCDEQSDIYLYKIHGSIDWTSKDGRLVYFDGTSQIDVDDLAIIFGTNYKLQYVDPFLFFAYEFRRWTLDGARLIICVGYSFSDEHINGILGQALKNDSTKRLLTVAPGEESEEDKHIEGIAGRLGADQGQIVWWRMTAKELFEDKLNIDELSEVPPKQSEPF